MNILLQGRGAQPCANAFSVLLISGHGEFETGLLWCEIRCEYRIGDVVSTNINRNN